MFGDPIERVRGKPYRRYCRSWGGTVMPLRVRLPHSNFAPNEAMAIISLRRWQ